jgi:hypothetical protein
VLQIGSVEAPLGRPQILGPAVGLVRRALAVGLMRDRQRVDRLDLALVRAIAREAAAAGIGQAAAMELMSEPSPHRLGTLIGRLDDALSGSPQPERELARLGEVFDLDQLAVLAGTSVVSLRRYLAGTRSVPDALALRIHWLALVVGDLGGAYNRFGIRRWFERPRSQLRNRAPRTILAGDWDPDNADVQRVRQLAAALAGPGGAT